ncbi:sugar phosphate nucleotidyltransferase [Streptomyces lavendulae]|uniref:sugar phosphate nucleotidyltransferase n=1 Tax=Streptomyces lavendulae TaxID=1914 RepID=UPI003676659A
MRTLGRLAQRPGPASTSGRPPVEGFYVKAVIAVAGMGPRFFPIAKTINKCMLPILDQPVLAYEVADCLAAGADQIAIVTGTGTGTGEASPISTAAVAVAKSG